MDAPPGASPDLGKEIFFALFPETLCRSRLVLVGRDTRVYYVSSLFAYRCVDNGYSYEDMSDVGTFVSLTTIPC